MKQKNEQQAQPRVRAIPVICAMDKSQRDDWMSKVAQARSLIDDAEAYTSHTSKGLKQLPAHLLTVDDLLDAAMKALDAAVFVMKQFEGD